MKERNIGPRLSNGQQNVAKDLIKTDGYMGSLGIYFDSPQNPTPAKSKGSRGPPVIVPLATIVTRLLTTIEKFPAPTVPEKLRCPVKSLSVEYDTVA